MGRYERLSMLDEVFIAQHVVFSSFSFAWYPARIGGRSVSSKVITLHHGGDVDTCIVFSSMLPVTVISLHRLVRIASLIDLRWPKCLNGPGEIHPRSRPTGLAEDVVWHATVGQKYSRYCPYIVDFHTIAFPSPAYHLHLVYLANHPHLHLSSSRRITKRLPQAPTHGN